jgi:hypothetical protein
LIAADEDQDLFFSLASLSCFQTSFVSGFLPLALLRKPNREAKAWRRWWWWWWPWTSFVVVVVACDFCDRSGVCSTTFLLELAVDSFFGLEGSVSVSL